MRNFFLQIENDRQPWPRKCDDDAHSSHEVYLLLNAIFYGLQVPVSSSNGRWHGTPVSLEILQNGHVCPWHRQSGILRQKRTPLCIRTWHQRSQTRCLWHQVRRPHSFFCTHTLFATLSWGQQISFVSKNFAKRKRTDESIEYQQGYTFCAMHSVVLHSTDHLWFCTLSHHFTHCVMTYVDPADLANFQGIASHWEWRDGPGNWSQQPRQREVPIEWRPQVVGYDLRSGQLQDGAMQKATKVVSSGLCLPSVPQ